MVVQMNSKRSKNLEANASGKTKALLVAQEISFAKVLAGNDKRLRDRGVKRLRKWLTSRARSNNEFNDDDFMRLWKGLFYCIWMADKPLVQEEVCDTICSLISCFDKPALAFSFMKSFYWTIALEWNGIDQHRINKFQMLVRRFLRQCLLYVSQNDWNELYVEEFDSLLKQTFFPDGSIQSKRHVPGGLILHFCDIFVEELAKVSKGSVPEHALLKLLERFALYIGICPERSISKAICNNVFDRLIEQSPEGVEYKEKFAAWKQLGFPGDSLHCMERADDEEEDEDEGIDEVENFENGGEPLDPRAGKVDVYLPSITFNAKNVKDMIKGCQFKKFTTAATRKMLGELARKFDRLADCEYPLGYYEVSKVPYDPKDFKNLTKEAAESLLELQEQLKKESHVAFKQKGRAKGKRGSEMEHSDNDEDMEHSDNDTDMEYSDNDADMEHSDNDAECVVSKSLHSDQEVTPNGSGEHNEEAYVEIKSKLKPSKISKDSSLTEHEESGIIPHLKHKKKSKKMKSDIETGFNFTSEVLPGFDEANTNKDQARQSENGNQEKSNHLSEESCKSITQRKRTKDSGADSTALKKGRLSLEPSTESKSNFVVSDLLSNNSPELIPSSKPLKPKRRASLPARLEAEEITLTPAKEPKVASKCKKLKRKSDPWDDTLQEGEKEIIIRRDQQGNKRKSILKGVHQSIADDKKSLNRSLPLISPDTPGGSSKKVNFVLQRNRAQGTSEYLKTLRENPDIPYDAKKKPLHGVLKPSRFSSPINPFYLRKSKLT